MITKALLFRFESQTDEDTMDTFLEDLATEVSWEKSTQAWFGIRYMRGEFGVVSSFDDEAAREAHLAGTAAANFFGAQRRLMTSEPVTTKIEVLASKLPKVLEGVTKGLVLRFKAKPGKEAEVAKMLRDCQPLVDKEAGTLAWFANAYGEGQFGTFAVFADNGARFAHLTGQIPRELGLTGLALLGGAPEVSMVDVITGTSRQRD
jgi:quinol monooxygenase YgiN